MKATLLCGIYRCVHNMYLLVYIVCICVMNLMHNIYDLYIWRTTKTCLFDSDSRFYSLYLKLHHIVDTKRTLPFNTGNICQIGTLVYFWISRTALILDGFFSGMYILLRNGIALTVTALGCWRWLQPEMISASMLQPWWRCLETYLAGLLSYPPWN